MSALRLHPNPLVCFGFCVGIRALLLLLVPSTVVPVMYLLFVLLRSSVLLRRKRSMVNAHGRNPVR